jgi:hypothetical protein
VKAPAQGAATSPIPPATVTNTPAAEPASVLPAQPAAETKPAPVTTPAPASEAKPAEPKPAESKPAPEAAMQAKKPEEVQKDKQPSSSSSPQRVFIQIL